MISWRVIKPKSLFLSHTAYGGKKKKIENTVLSFLYNFSTVFSVYTQRNQNTFAGLSKDVLREQDAVRVLIP